LKAIVLLSGGLDSTVLLARMKDARIDIGLALSLNYGQLHAREIECAKYQAKKYQVPWKEIDVREVFRGIETPLLGAGEIPETSYAEQLEEIEGQDKIKTYVPNRNMILLSIAAAHAIASGADTVAYAAHMDDAEGGAYPDCTPDFVDSMNKALKTQGVQLYAPFIQDGWKKVDIVRAGLAVNVDFSQTWSCYKGEDRPCGVCGTCRDRKSAFEKNEVDDPTLSPKIVE